MVNPDAMIGVAFIADLAYDRRPGIPPVSIDDPVLSHLEASVHNSGEVVVNSIISDFEKTCPGFEKADTTRRGWWV
jgi:hypothetical protein